MVKGSESSLPCMLHLLLSGRARPQIQLRAKPPTEGRAQGRYTTACLLPCVLRPHAFWPTWTCPWSYWTEQGLVQQGREDGFQHSDFVSPTQKDQDRTVEKGKKTFVFMFWSLRSEQVEKARQRWRRLQEAGACIKKPLRPIAMQREVSSLTPFLGTSNRMFLGIWRNHNSRGTMSSPLQQIRHLQVTVRLLSCAEVHCWLISITGFQSWHNSTGTCEMSAARLEKLPL